MRRMAVFQGVRTLRFRDVLGRCEARDLSQLEAAEVLGVSERTFRHWCRRFEDEGEAGLVDRRLGKPSAKRVPLDEALQVEELNRSRYAGFTAKHFHERLCVDHVFRWGYTWSKTFLHGRGLVAPAPRRPLVGMMLHQDGSTHPWLPGGAEDDLIASLDDAPGTLYSAFLVEHPVELPGACRGVRRPRPAVRLLYRPRQPLLPHPRGRAAGWTRASPPKWDGRWPCSASSTSRPTRRRPAGAPSAPSSPSRSACPRSSPCATSPPAPRPTTSSPRPSSPITTPASRRRPSSRARPSSPSLPSSGGTSSVPRRSAPSATTTPCASTASSCRSRPGRTTSGAKVRVQHYPDASLAVLHDPRSLAPYQARRNPDRRHLTQEGRVIPLDAPRRWTCGQRCALSTSPPAQHLQPSRQLMCYINRSTQFAMYSPKAGPRRPRHRPQSLRLRSDLVYLKLWDVDRKSEPDGWQPDIDMARQNYSRLRIIVVPAADRRGNCLPLGVQQMLFEDPAKRIVHDQNSLDVTPG